MRKRRLLSSVILVVVMLFAPNVCLAAGNSNNSNQIQPKGQILIINNETGETTTIEVTPVLVESTQLFKANGEVSKSEVYEMNIPLDVLSKDKKDNTEDGGVNTFTHINYDEMIRYDGAPMVRINRVSGGWTIMNDLVSISDRRIFACDQASLAGHSVEQFPDNDNFNIYTGWDYVGRISGIYGPHVIAQCVGHVYGMSNTHDIITNIWL